MDVVSAVDSSDSKSGEDIVEVIKQESDIERDEDGADIGDHNNRTCRRQSTFSRSGKIQGNLCLV